MRTFALLILLGGLVGCSPIPKTGNPVAAGTPAPLYRPRPAAALAFDPPMVQYAPLPDLSREGRDSAAFMGYQQAVIDSAYVYQRDEQRGGGRFRDRFDRTAYSNRTTVLYR